MKRKNTIKNLCLAVGVAAGVSLTAWADDYVCDGMQCVFGPEDMVDNLVVMNGGTAELNGTTVWGNIKVESGGNLVADAITVGGNVQASGAGDLELRGTSWVGGNVQIDYSTGAILVEDSIVDGSIQLQDNSATAINLEANEIMSDVQIFNNLSAGGITVTDNSIGGNLQCKENDPDPVHSGNTVGGDYECED